MSGDPFDVPVDDLRARRSAKWGLAGAGELPAWVAEMDVRLATPVQAALQRSIAASDTGYGGDTRAYREAFAGFAARRWAWRVDADHCGCMPDLAAGGVLVLRRLVPAGSRVVVPTPCYPEFLDWVADAGLVAVQVPLLRQQDGGALDLEAIRAAVDAGARAVLLANPHNPTGRAWQADDLGQLADLADTADALVVSDEVHAPLTLPGHEFVPFLSVSDAARRVGVALHSASKGWNLAGLKAALVVGDPAGPQVSIDPVGWVVGLLGLVAGEAAFDHGESWLDEVVQGLAARMQHVGARLADEAPLVGFAPPDAGYLAWLDLRRALPGVDDPAEVVRRRSGLVLANGPRFGDAGRGWARLNVATPIPLLDEALDRLVGSLR